MLCINTECSIEYYRLLCIRAAGGQQLLRRSAVIERVACLLHRLLNPLCLRVQLPFDQLRLACVPRTPQQRGGIWRQRSQQRVDRSVQQTEERLHQRRRRIAPAQLHSRLTHRGAQVGCEQRLKGAQQRRRLARHPSSSRAECVMDERSERQHARTVRMQHAVHIVIEHNLTHNTHTQHSITQHSTVNRQTHTRADGRLTNTREGNEEREDSKGKQAGRLVGGWKCGRKNEGREMWHVTDSLTRTLASSVRVDSLPTSIQQSSSRAEHRTTAANTAQTADNDTAMSDPLRSRRLCSLPRCGQSAYCVIVADSAGLSGSVSSIRLSTISSTSSGYSTSSN